MPPVSGALARRSTSIYEPTFINTRPRRRRSNGAGSKALVKAKASAARANKRARNLKERVSSQGIIYASGGFITGAALAGVLEATLDWNLAGIDGRLFVGAALVATSVFAIDDPWQSLFVGSAGLGMAAPAISETVDNALSGFFSL